MERGEAKTMQDRMAEAAIAAVADWAGAIVDYREVTAPVMSPMHKGVDSLCFAVDVDAKPFFLKIVHPEVRAGSDVRATFEAARAAAALGIAPLALHCLPDQDAIVYERLGSGWATAKTDKLREPAVMVSVVEAKRKIHAGAPLARSWSIFDSIRAMSRATTKSGAVDGAKVLWMIAAAHDIERALKAAGFDTAPCHADGLASNIMVDGRNAVRLVDFDRAGNTDPLYDLGITLNEAYDFEEEMSPALEAYEGSIRRVTLDRCRLYAIADDLYWGLWSAQMNSVSARRGIEFLKYAQWRLLRCRMALQDPDFERKLRMI